MAGCSAAASPRARQRRPGDQHRRRSPGRVRDLRPPLPRRGQAGGGPRRPPGGPGDLECRRSGARPHPQDLARPDHLVLPGAQPAGAPRPPGGRRGGRAPGRTIRWSSPAAANGRRWRGSPRCRSPTAAPPGTMSPTRSPRSGSPRPSGCRRPPWRPGSPTSARLPRTTPAGASLFEIGGVHVLLDYAHNPHGLRALLELARTLPANRRLLLLGQAGDRDDEAIRELARTAWSFRPDRILLKELPAMLRGRAPGEVPALLEAELLRLGSSRGEPGARRPGDRGRGERPRLGSAGGPPGPPRPHRPGRGARPADRVAARPQPLHEPEGEAEVRGVVEVEEVFVEGEVGAPGGRQGLFPGEGRDVGLLCELGAVEALQGAVRDRHLDQDRRAVEEAVLVGGARGEDGRRRPPQLLPAPLAHPGEGEVEPGAGEGPRTEESARRRRRSRS